MGWAKYAEDNFEIYLERTDAMFNKHSEQQKIKVESHLFTEQNAKNNSFSRVSAEKSCFSLR